jgi:hypothetical protein
VAAPAVNPNPFDLADFGIPADSGAATTCSNFAPESSLDVSSSLMTLGAFEIARQETIKENAALRALVAELRDEKREEERRPLCASSARIPSCCSNSTATAAQEPECSTEGGSLRAVARAG